MVRQKMKTNLSEIFPELGGGWQVQDNGNYHKPLEHGEFELYIAQCKENSVNNDFRAEIGLYSKSPFKNPERLKRRFAWYMAEFLLHPTISYEKRADGWYMFVTDSDNFKHYVKFARQTVENE